MRALLLLVLVGCPKTQAPAPQATPEAPPEPVSVDATFDWPDGAWGSLTRRIRSGDVTLVIEADVGVSRGEFVSVTENVRNLRLEPEAAELDAALALEAYVAMLEWTWRLDDAGARVEHADRREAAAPLYDADKVFRNAVDLLWPTDEDARRAATEAHLPQMPTSVGYEPLRDARILGWNEGLPTLSGRTWEIGTTVDGRNATEGAAPCHDGRKPRSCLVVTGEGESWRVEPANLLPWQVTRTRGSDVGSLTVIEEWSWTIL